MAYPIPYIPFWYTISSINNGNSIATYSYYSYGEIRSWPYRSKPFTQRTKWQHDLTTVVTMKSVCRNHTIILQ